MPTKKAIRLHHKPDFTKNPEFFRRLIDSLEGYAIFTLDFKGRVTSWNAGAEKILGYRDEEIIGRHYSVFFTPEDRREKLPQFEIQSATDTYHPVSEGWRIRKNGGLLWATSLVFPLKDDLGKVVGFTKIMRDRTERRRLEQQKDIFIGMASHELKTPITSLKLFSDILHSQAKEAKAPAIMESVEVIRSQVDRLVRLMNELLDVSRIQSGEMKLSVRPFDLNELVKEVVGQIQATAESHRIDVTSRARSRVRADRIRIGQVLTNLVANAVKYSPAADKVIIRMHEEKGKVVVAVQDFGIGIPKEEQRRVFDRFFRATQAKQKHISGFGLGLYISSEIMRKHGSEIRVRSFEGKGSTFYFSLPAVPSKKLKKKTA